MPSTTILYARWEGRCGRLDGDQICSQRSVFRPKGITPPEAPDVERSPVNEAILTALAELPFRFRFRLCASFRGGSIFRNTPCTGTRTSRNHFASPCDIFDGSPRFDDGTETDSDPDGNRTLAGPLGAKCKARASGTTLSPWTSHGFICSVNMI
jgi:hypothetical protein